MNTKKQVIQMTAGEMNSLLAFIEDYNFEEIRVSPGYKKRLQLSREIVNAVLSKDKTYLRFVPPDNIFSVLLSSADIKAIKTLVKFACGTGRAKKFNSKIQPDPKKNPFQKLNQQDMSKPLINLIIRTSNRPRFFRECYESIQKQTYSNIRTIVSFDDSETFSYVKDYNIDLLLEVRRNSESENQKGQTFHPGYFETPFPANLYLNRLLKYCLPGYVVFLDDDNKLTKPESLQKIVNRIENEHQMILWPVQFLDYQVPNKNHFKQIPKPCQIDLGGFAFHTDYINHCLFDSYSLSDYRAALNLFMHIPEKKYINEPLLSVQRYPGLGLRKDK